MGHGEGGKEGKRGRRRGGEERKGEGGNLEFEDLT